MQLEKTDQCKSVGQWGLQKLKREWYSLAIVPFFLIPPFHEGQLEEEANEPAEGQEEKGNVGIQQT